MSRYIVSYGKGFGDYKTVTVNGLDEAVQTYNRLKASYLWQVTEYGLHRILLEK